uniref:Exocyst complex component 6B n=1 Tax=Laticauda laticaudata TaxID=8630 RepID=A0A8C5RDN2_LATLA
IEVHSPESPETAAEHERILREVDSTDTACLGPTLRSVYDGSEHGRFMEKLDARIRNHDREIEKMCNFHYQGFVDSITEFLKVRAEAQKLKNQVTDTNRKLQLESKQLVGAMEELRQCRLQQWNISATVDKLSQCLPVLEMESKLREQMKSKRHYPALKTLEHLERMCLPQVSHYRFCKVMVENIPRLREEIKDVSMSDLKDFLESIRKHSDKIGETAMKQVSHQAGGVGEERETGAPCTPNSLPLRWAGLSVSSSAVFSPCSRRPWELPLLDLWQPVFKCQLLRTSARGLCLPDPCLGPCSKARLDQMASGLPLWGWEDTLLASNAGKCRQG